MDRYLVEETWVYCVFQSSFGSRSLAFSPFIRIGAATESQFFWGFAGSINMLLELASVCGVLWGWGWVGSKFGTLVKPFIGAVVRHVVVCQVFFHSYSPCALPSSCHLRFCDVVCEYLSQRRHLWMTIGLFSYFFSFVHSFLFFVIGRIFVLGEPRWNLL